MDELEELRARVARLEAERTLESRFFEVTLEMLCTASLDTGRFVHLNPSWSKVLGYTVEELRSAPFVEFVHPDDRADTLAAASRLGEGRDVVRFVNRYRHRSGEYRWIEWASTADLGERLIYAAARDVTARRETEEALRVSQTRADELLAQLREHNERLQRQADALRELANPVIPLADDVIAMPLIGEIDPARAEQILDGLLAGVARARARVVILDITGVRRLDGPGAAALLRAAHAVKLLGAEAVLTGVRPAIAQTLVGLDIDLGAVTTRQNLRDGIAFAFERARGDR